LAGLLPRQRPLLPGKQLLLLLKLRGLAETLLQLGNLHLEDLKLLEACLPQVLEQCIQAITALRLQ